MKVVLIRCADTSEDLLAVVLAELRAVPGPIQFMLGTEPMELPEGDLHFHDFFQALEMQRVSMALPEDDFLGLVTDRSNAENWFAAFDDEDRNLFVHADDWKHHVACPPEVAIAYEVVTNVFQRLTFSTLDKTLEIAHQHPIGCINDMCSWKPDMNLKLRTGDMCIDCLQFAEESGLKEDFKEQVLEILEKLRVKALFSPRVHSPGSENLPFPVAYTRRKLSMTTDPLRKFLCLLDYFDSLVRTTVLTLGRVHLGKDFNRFAEKNRISKLPALGLWMKSLHSLSRKLSSSTDFTLNEDLAQSLKDVARKAEDGKIITMRNSKRAHGYLGLSDKRYEKHYERTLPCIKDLESILFPILASFDFHYVLAASRIDDDRVEIVSKKLMGDHPDFPEEEKAQDMNGASPPIKNRVHAVTNGNRWHDLHDSLVYEICETCDHERLLISDGEVYLDTYVGHRSPEPDTAVNED